MGSGGAGDVCPPWCPGDALAMPRLSGNGDSTPLGGTAWKERWQEGAAVPKMLRLGGKADNLTPRNTGPEFT